MPNYLLACLPACLRASLSSLTTGALSGQSSHLSKLNFCFVAFLSCTQTKSTGLTREGETADERVRVNERGIMEKWDRERKRKRCCYGQSLPLKMFWQKFQSNYVTLSLPNSESLLVQHSQQFWWKLSLATMVLPWFGVFVCMFARIVMTNWMGINK